eukprot:3191301-Prymnesium_polylepis.1
MASRRDNMAILEYRVTSPCIKADLCAQPLTPPACCARARCHAPQHLAARHTPAHSPPRGGRSGRPL